MTGVPIASQAEYAGSIPVIRSNYWSLIRPAHWPFPGPQLVWKCIRRQVVSCPEHGTTGGTYGHEQFVRVSPQTSQRKIPSPLLPSRQTHLRRRCCVGGSGGGVACCGGSSSPSYFSVVCWVPVPARPCRHSVGDRWFVDETYVKVAGTCTGRSISTARSLRFWCRSDETLLPLQGSSR